MSNFSAKSQEFPRSTKYPFSPLFIKSRAPPGRIVRGLSREGDDIHLDQMLSPVRLGFFLGKAYGEEGVKESCGDEDHAQQYRKQPNPITAKQTDRKDCRTYRKEGDSQHDGMGSKGQQV